jgi:hypothetical protein
VPSNEIEEDISLHPKEDFYGKNIMESATVCSTSHSLMIVEEYFDYNL